MNDPEFLLVAVTHPKFKLAWADDMQLSAQCTLLLEQAVLSCATPSTGPSITDDRPSGSISSDEGSDFFDSKQAGADAVPSQKHVEYLNDNSNDLSMLYSHPEVRQLFIRYNTCLPSSAPVERLFSAGALILTKRRNRLSDALFETLLMLKANKSYW